MLGLVRSAWLCDDAFISFRSVRNVVEGHGLTYNPVERVQSFTHPLWVLLLIPFYALTGEIVFTALALSMGLTLCALWIAYRIFSGSPKVMVCFLGACIASAAWTDYSTSGLENPLSHCLLLLFWAEYWGKKRALVLSLLVSFAVLNRMDTALIYFPVMAAFVWETLGKQSFGSGLRSWQSWIQAFDWRSWSWQSWAEVSDWRSWSWRTWSQASAWRPLGLLALGQLPFLCWETFSLVYYGFPFPNTAYAKLGMGLSNSELWAQGWAYWMHSWNQDPATMIVLTGGMLLGLRKRNTLFFSLGILGYTLYTLKVGGDFMEGRFFTTTFLLGLLILGRWFQKGGTDRPVGAAVGAIGKLLPRIHWAPLFGLGLVVLAVFTHLPAAFAPLPTIRPSSELIDDHGICDERSYYSPYSGFLQRLLHPNQPLSKWSSIAEDLHQRQLKSALMDNMGFIGWETEAALHLVDLLGLTDPLLARLPALYQPNWRVGHYLHVVPEGYLESILDPRPGVLDSALNTYLGHLRTLTRGPLWSRKRWQTIWNFNLDRYDDLIDREHYRLPIVHRFTLAQVQGMDSLDLNHFKGVEISLGRPRPVHEITIEVDPNAHYQLLVYHGDNLQFEKPFVIRSEITSENRIQFPVDVARADRLVLYPLDRNGLYWLRSPELR